MTGEIQKKPKTDGELGRPESGPQRPTHLKNKENEIEGIQNDINKKLYDRSNKKNKKTDGKLGRPESPRT